MANTVMAGALLTPGVRAEFSKVYAPHYQGVKELLGEIMWLGATSDKLTEIYAYLETAPYPRRWDRGTVIGSKNMKSVQFSVTNRDWGHRIYVHENDIADDQTGSIFQQARGLGQNWATLPERVFFQILLGTTDDALLPVVPVAADGSALYINTSRFGSANGNVVAVTGTSNEQQIITDLMSVQQRFIEFQDTEGQPLWNHSELAKWTLVHGSALTLVMARALTMLAIHSYVDGSSTTNVRTGAGTDNVLKTAGMDIKPLNTQRITDSTYYVFLRNLPDYKKPMFQQVREPFFEAQGNWETSDHTRDTGERYIQFKSREGYGIPVPYGTCKVA